MKNGIFGNLGLGTVGSVAFSLLAWSVVHTVNDADDFRRLRARGVYGISTDTLCGCVKEDHDG